MTIHPSSRTFLTPLSLAFLLSALSQSLLNTAQAAPKLQVYAGQGIMVGEVSEDRAFAQVRLTNSETLRNGDLPGVEGIVRFQLLQAGNVISTQDVPAKAKHDFIARATLKELAANTPYEVRTEMGVDLDSLQAGPSAEFRTLAGKQSSRVKIVVVTGMNYAKFHGDDRIDREQHLIENNTALPKPYAGPDKHLGYPALASILKTNPDYFVGTGDNVYYDTPDAFRAKSEKEMRLKWHEQFVQPRFRELFAKVPTYWMVDDHDYRIDDGDNSGDYLPTSETAQRILKEQLPYGAIAGEQVKTYRTHRLNKDLQIWLLEHRFFRSPNSQKDGPDKSIWGSEQKRWLKESLAASDATFKVLISPNPMIGPDDARKTDNHTNIGGFQHERDEFFRWLKESGVAEKNFCIVCGDRHWQYHSVHPSGIEEFSCGALVDANSRLGRAPGDAKSTDPLGQIKQPYTQKEASGGFLMLDLSPAGAAPASLSFRFYDEKGTVLHETRKQAATKN